LEEIEPEIETGYNCVLRRLLEDCFGRSEAWIRRQMGEKWTRLGVANLSCLIDGHCLEARELATGQKCQ